MTIRLLADENVPHPSIVLLRESGWDFESVAESMSSATDRVILEYAASHERWLLTFDRDFGELVFAEHAEPPPAIIYFRQASYQPTWPGQALIDLLRTPEFALHHLVVISGATMRRRLMPSRANRSTI